MNDGPAKVALRFLAVTPARVWKERMHDKSLAVADVEEGEGPWARRETEVALTLLPFEIALIETP
jgi:hypothetical protein